MNWQSGLGGGLSGAGTGAMFGSMFGPIGTGVGAGVGGLAGLLGGLFGGEETPASNQQIPNMTPEQQQALKQILQMGMGGMQNMQQNQPSFAPYENYARQQFQSQTIPSIAERFTAMGGGQRSSAFTGALGQAGAGLESQLAMGRSGFDTQQQGMRQNMLMNLLNMGLQPQGETMYNPRQPGMMESLLPSLIGGASSALPYLLQAKFGGGQK